MRRPVAAAAWPWDTIANAIGGGGQVDEEWWRECLMPYLRDMPREMAQLLYQDLCHVQLAVCDKERIPRVCVLGDVTTWSDSERVRRFWDVTMSNGRLAELVADCIDLPNAEAREARWRATSMAYEATAAAQRRHTLYQKELSAFRLAAREENRAAYDEVAAEVADDGDSPETWRVVIRQTPEGLARKPRQFWHALQLARCTERQKRAVQHKLELCQMYSAYPEEIAKHRATLTADLFANAAPRPPALDDAAPGARRRLGHARARIRRALVRLVRCVRRAGLGGGQKKSTASGST